jgi:hypothetical protein
VTTALAVEVGAEKKRSLYGEEKRIDWQRRGLEVGRRDTRIVWKNVYEYWRTKKMSLPGVSTIPINVLLRKKAITVKQSLTLTRQTATEMAT